MHHLVVTMSQAIPHDVLRDKRGLACSSCRQVKLRCIRQEGQSRCVRCVKRGEDCTFAPRSHDSAWHEQMASDLRNALEQLSRLTEHVDALTRLVPGGEALTQDETATVSQRRRVQEHGYEASSSQQPTGDSETAVRVPLTSSDRDNPVLSSLNLQRPFLGCDDPRVNIISKLIVTPEEAQTLFDYFNTMSFFGFDPLQIPYHPGGPTFISPLVLAVICAIASERVSPRHTKALYHEVFTLLNSSPTGSFMGSIDLETVRLIPEEWDPELGIGPEEVVAVSYLALFIDDRIRGPNIGRLSRRWVEGWITWSQTGDHATLGESIGLIPPPRQVSSEEISRIWLMSFISRRLSDLQSHYPSSTMPDPDEHCSRLTSPGDSTLVQSAQMIAALSIWYERWRESKEVMERFELTRKANLAFDKIHFELEFTPVFELVFLFAKAVTHASLARVCDPTNEDQRALKRPNWAAGVDASVEMLRVCSEMPGVLNLPITLYTMLDQAVEILLEARSANTFWSASVTHYMDQIGSALSPGGRSHRHTADLMRRAIQTL